MKRIAISSVQPELRLLQRKLSPPLLLALLIQFASVCIWAATLQARVAELETKITQIQGADARFARLEERMDAVREDLARISRSIDRLAERRR